MSYLTLPKRVLSSPLIEYTNFVDGSHVNLIRISKPYADGTCYAVHETTKSWFCSNGLFKDYESAKVKYELMVKNGGDESAILSQGKLDHNTI